MIQIKAQVDLERSLPRGYLHILRTPSLRKRFVCTALVWIMGQSTGINVIATLTPVLFASLGFDTTLQLALSIVWTVCLQIGCSINVHLLDRVGRKALLGMYCTCLYRCYLLHPHFPMIYFYFYSHQWYST